MDPKPLDHEWSDLETTTRTPDPEVNVFQAMLREAMPNQGGRVGRRVDRNAKPPQEIGQRADVILVAMRDDDRTEPFALLPEPAKIRVHDVGTQLIGEPHAAVDGDRGVA
jgi:hypothetical protein